MATSDRGLVDVERFDLEPQRPILHGLLGDVDVALLSGMSSREKVPHMLRFLEAEQLSPRGRGVRGGNRPHIVDVAAGVR